MLKLYLKRSKQLDGTECTQHVKASYYIFEVIIHICINLKVCMYILEAFNAQCQRKKKVKYQFLIRSS